MSSIEPSEQTSTDTYDANNAVDGIYLPPDGHEAVSLAHSDSKDNSPWWMVDLEHVYCVWAVNILNRAKKGLVNDSIAM